MQKNTAKIYTSFLAASILLTASLAYAQNKTEKTKMVGHRNQIVATDFVPADGVTDASDAIQKLIDDNPNRTIYFPDGTYLLKKPILTPASPKRSVSLVLDNYAVIKASDDWTSDEALVRLGASHPANDINTIGSVYGLDGGIIDGSGKAKGISIDGGRETFIRNVSIKHVQVGIHIKRGANSGSSDSDVRDVNIVGNNKADSIGVLLDGYDNTLTNMRIASVNIGILMKSGGNSLRNLHPLYIFNSQNTYETSCGFVDLCGSNWYSFCYSDQFSVGFKLKPEIVSIFNNCFCYWYSGKVPFQTAIKCDGKFNSIFTDFRAGFSGEVTVVRSLILAEPGGQGFLQNVVLGRRTMGPEDKTKEYLQGRLIQ